MTVHPTRPKHVRIACLLLLRVMCLRYDVLTYKYFVRTLLFLLAGTAVAYETVALMQRLWVKQVFLLKVPFA